MACGECRCGLSPAQIVELDARFDFEKELGRRPWALPALGGSGVRSECRRDEACGGGPGACHSMFSMNSTSGETSDPRLRTLPELNLLTDLNMPCPIVDSHSHAFPTKLMQAVQAFFENSYWPVAYPAGTADVDLPLAHGTTHACLLPYAHKAGIASGLNEYILNFAKKLESQFGYAATPLATVFPGEPNAGDILAEAFAAGAKGVKLHAHVQYCAPNDFFRLDDVYSTCVRFKKPILFHAGSSPNVPIMTNTQSLSSTLPLCQPEFIRQALVKYPGLTLIVPHVGSDETEAYLSLAREFPNLYLDTTMTLHLHSRTLLQNIEDGGPSLNETESKVMSGRWSLPALRGLFEELGSRDRLLYGTDYPNISHNFSLEARCILAMGLSQRAVEGIFYGAAAKVYGLDTGKLWERYWANGGQGGDRVKL